MANDCEICHQVRDCNAKVTDRFNWQTAVIQLLCNIADGSDIGSGAPWTPILFSALGSTVETVKPDGGILGGYHIYNPNINLVAQSVYAQVFDTAGAVVLGTTVPTLSLGIGPGQAVFVEFARGVLFENGIKVAGTNTATGAVAPTVGLVANFFYR